MACLLDNQPLKLTSHSSLAGNKQRNHIMLFFLMPLQGVWKIPVLLSQKDSCKESLHKIFIHRKLLAASEKDFVHGLLKALSWLYMSMRVSSGYTRLSLMEVKI